MRPPRSKAAKSAQRIGKTKYSKKRYGQLGAIKRKSSA